MSSKALLNEMNNAKKYCLDIQDTDKTILLTQNNVSKVLAMISYDSTYNKVFDKEAEYKLKKGKEICFSTIEDKENFVYFGSSAYWFDRLNCAADDNIEEYKYCLYKAICAVDNENSTHLNGDKVGRKQIWERLIIISFQDLKKALINEDIEIIRRISHPTTEGRKNISFASKFCHYACRNVLDEEHWDHYPIIDTILKESLPIYAKKYNINYDLKKYKGKDIIESYKEFTYIINELSKKSGISRTGIDQLLWYYYKGHEIPKIK